MIYKKGPIFSHELLYKYGIQTKRNNAYIKQILNNLNFVEDIDYNIIDVYINSGKTLKHIYMLTADSFRIICMNSKSEKSKDIILYFVEMEKIIKMYLEYEVEFFQKQKEKKINDLIEQYEKERNIGINKELNKFDQTYEKNPGYVYVMTTLGYLRQNCFKIGFSKKVKKREDEIDGVNLETVFTVSSITCDFIKHSNFETILHNIFKEFRCQMNKEFFQLKYVYIKKIIMFMVALFKFSKEKLELEVNQYIDILRINKLKYYNENDEYSLMTDLKINNNINSIFCHRVNYIIPKIMKKKKFSVDEITDENIKEINIRIFDYTPFFTKQDVIDILHFCEIKYKYDTNKKIFIFLSPKK